MATRLYTVPYAPLDIPTNDWLITAGAPTPLGNFDTGDLETHTPAGRRMVCAAAYGGEDELRASVTEEFSADTQADPTFCSAVLVSPLLAAGATFSGSLAMSVRARAVTAGGGGGGGVTPPTLAHEFETASWSTTSTSKTAAASSEDGELFLALGATSEGSAQVGTPTGGVDITWTDLGSRPVTPNSSQSYCEAWSAMLDGQAWTFSMPREGTGQPWGFNLLGFTGHDGIGATVVTDNGTTTASDAQIEIETTRDHSAIALIIADWNSIDGTDREYLEDDAGTATELSYFHSGAYGLYVVVYQDAGAAGVKTIGLAPQGGMRWVAAAAEVLGIEDEEPAGLTDLSWYAYLVDVTGQFVGDLVPIRTDSITPLTESDAGVYVEADLEPELDGPAGVPTRIVVEYGFIGSGGVVVTFGGNGTDHDAVDGDTSGDVGWVEFSDSLAWAGAPHVTEAWPDAMTALGPAQGPPACAVVASGEGASEGMGASTRDQRWLNQLVDTLRTWVFGGSAPMGGAGYVPAAYSERLRETSPSDAWATDTEFTLVEGASAFEGTSDENPDGVVRAGPGLRGVRLAAEGDGLDFVQPPDTGTQELPGLPVLGGGTNVVEEHTSDTEGGMITYEDEFWTQGGFQSLASNPDQGGGLMHIYGLADGVPMAVFGALYLASEQEDSAEGVLPIDASRAGITAGEVAALTILPTPDGALGYEPALNTMTYFPRAVTFAEYGQEEYVTASRTPDELLVDLLQAAGVVQMVWDAYTGALGEVQPRPFLILVVPHEPDNGLVDGGQTATWADYRDRILEAARLLGAIGVEWDSYPDTDTTIDGRYPDDAAHAAFAAEMAALLEGYGGGPASVGGVSGPFTGWGIPI